MAYFKCGLPSANLKTYFTEFTATTTASRKITSGFKPKFIIYITSSGTAPSSAMAYNVYDENYSTEKYKMYSGSWSEIDVGTTNGINSIEEDGLYWNTAATSARYIKMWIIGE